jgi:polyhydroxyalkanoate synthesis repressor PhaR
MAEPQKPLLIKRYASRRLYNTETSDYVTLEDIAGFVRAGREVQIVDLKSGDDLTRQYLLQIVAEHESKGDTVLPTNVLTDLVRSYTTNIQSVVPQFLAASFEMLRDGQTKVIENMNAIPNPMSTMPGFDLMRKQQEAFMKTMMVGVPGWNAGAAVDNAKPAQSENRPQSESDAQAELAEIKAQFAALQDKLSKL